MLHHLQIEQAGRDGEQENAHEDGGDDAANREDSLLDVAILDADAADHGFSSARIQRSWSRLKIPTITGHSSAPMTGASQRPNVVTGLPVAPSIQNRMN